MLGSDEEGRLGCSERIEVHVVDEMSHMPHRRQRGACVAVDLALLDYGPAEAGIYFHQRRVSRNYK